MTARSTFSATCLGTRQRDRTAMRRPSARPARSPSASDGRGASAARHGVTASTSKVCTVFGANHDQNRLPLTYVSSWYP